MASLRVRLGQSPRVGSGTGRPRLPAARNGAWVSCAMHVGPSDDASLEIHPSTSPSTGTETGGQERGNPSIRPAMMSRWTWDVPPAIPAALLHSHCLLQGPDREDDASRPVTSNAASAMCWVMDVQASLTQLDSGPGSSPRPSRVRVRNCAGGAPRARRRPGPGRRPPGGRRWHRSPAPRRAGGPGRSRARPAL